MINFSISEFNISGEDIPQDIADKILKYHIDPMQTVRDIFNNPIFPSMKSGYRSTAWEKSHGRPGGSQHTFQGKGAVDWTCHDFETEGSGLLDLIINHTEYSRITLYTTFIHCDYKTTNSNERELYSFGNNSKWKFIKYI